jgi:hypothetical protein
VRFLYVLAGCLLAAHLSAQQPQALPEGLILYTPDSVQVKSQDMVTKGHLTMLVVWNSMMRPAFNELDSLHKVYPAWHEKYGVELVTVCWEYPHAYPQNLRKFLAKRQWPYPVYVDTDKKFITAMGVNNFPTTFFFNRTGKMVHRSQGFDGTYIQKYEEKLAELSIE